MRRILLQLSAAFLFLHQVQSASLFPLPGGVNPIKVAASTPAPPSSQPLSIVLLQNRLSPKPHGKACTRDFVTMLVKKDGCRPALLRTKQCTGSTYSSHAYNGFNSTVYQEILTTACTPLYDRNNVRRKTYTLTFICNGRRKREKVYLTVPRKCVIVQKKEILPVLPPHPATMPPVVAPTTDC